MSTERPIGSAVGRISDPSSKTADAKMEPGAPPDLRMSRRDLLQGMAAAGVLATLPRRLLAAADAPHPVTRYLATLARPDGGYAFADQADSHLTPTFGAIGCFHLLGLPPPNRDALVEFVRTHHPSRLKKLEQERRGFEYQQVQALAWLEADASEFREKISAWSEPLAYMKRYEQHGYPVFQSELGAVACRALLGLPLAPVQESFGGYVRARRRANGSFNNTLATDGGDGHVMNTLWGLQAWRTLGLPDERHAETIAWLRACQRPNGGFTWQPEPAFAGLDDVAYTRAAVRSLALLGAAPADRAGCLAYLHSLANPDGGYGDRPGWASNPMATYCAVDALAALDELQRPLPRPTPRRAPAAAALPANLRIFSIQVEAHGQGSPAEAVDLARALKIDLWGAKNAKPGWIARAQAIAAAQAAPVAFFVADEEYGTFVDVPGLGTYSHTADIIAPVGSDFGASLANAGVVSWPEFRTRRLAPLEKARGHLIWQFGENEELVRLYLDDTVERGGYAAISTFHFGNPDFTNTEPFLHRWRGRIPYIALQDSHGPEAWWFAETTIGTRTLFLGTEPTWDAWLEALRRNWVGAVRHDALSGFKTWMHTGSDEVLALLRARESEWRWWDNPAIQRPMVSLVALTPADEFETGRPQSGVTLRVRCAWETGPQGGLKKPLAEFKSLVVDGTEVTPALQTTVAPKAAANRTDQYHHYHLAQPARGSHRATAVVRVLESGQEVSRTIEFEVGTGL